MNKIVVKEMEYEEAKKLGIDNWTTWEGQPTKFNWFYSKQETAYILEGEVIITVDGEEFEIKKNMLVSFPMGMECKWDIHKTIKKAYKYNFPIE